jgi:hypothetical protein
MINPNLDYDNPVILGISGPVGGHAVIADGYGYYLSTLYHHLNMGWAGSTDAWHNLPNIDSSPSFTSVDKCVYNVFVSGSGEIISGRVTDMSDQPISAATVTAQGSSGPFTASTNIKGIYAIAKVPSSTTFTVTVTKDGYTFEPPQIVTTATSGGSTPGNRWEIDFHGMIGAYPVIQLSPDQLEFSAMASDPDPEPQILSVRNSGFGTLNWVINYDCNWLEVDPCEGSSTGDINEVTVSVDITGLAHGSYNCELTVSDPCAMNSPRIVNIFLHKQDLNKIFIPGKGEYPTIQAAIDAAVNGDTVVVTPGTYTGNGNRDLNFRGKAITLRSIDPDDSDMVAATVIDCQATEYDRHRGFYFHNKESGSTIVDGITITNGYAPDDIGGGIRCHVASPTIRNCIIKDNTAGIISGSDKNYGGGMYNHWSSPTLINCTFSGNSAQYGGGITNRYGGADPTLLNCTFIRNSARRGGGIHNQEGADPTLTNCTFSANSSTAYGAGMSNLYNSSPTLTNCSFVGNSSTQMAAGMNNNFDSCPTLANCVFRSNSATYDGGAMSNGNAGRPNLTNCIIIGNSAGRYGGAMFCLSNCSATLTNCTFVGNSSSSGRALACNTYNEEASNVQIINCILWDGGSEIWNNDNSTITVTYSNVQGSWPGTGNINADPRFVTGSEGDYYLSQVAAGQVVDSPCVDAGSDTAVSLGMDAFTTRTDQLRDLGMVDMGYHYPLIESADIDLDGDVDFKDYVILAAQWQYPPGIPAADIAPPGGDGVVDGKDLALLVDSWLWEE